MLIQNANVNLHVALLKSLNFIVTNIQESKTLDKFLIKDDLLLSCIAFDFYDFKNSEECLNYHVALLKSLALKLTSTNLSHFLTIEGNDSLIDVEKSVIKVSFPLLEKTMEYLESENEMIRIAGRNIVLSIFHSKNS